MKRTSPVRRILVTRLRFMGDVILTTPVLHALRQSNPKWEIGYLSENHYHVLLENHPDVDWNFGLGRGWKNYSSVIRTLRDMHFDVVVDLFGNPRSAWITRLINADCRIGGDFRGRRHFYTERIPNDGLPRSAVDFHLRYLEPLGIKAPPSPTRIVVLDSELKEAERMLARIGYGKKPGRLRIGIQPSASWPAKQWLPERFAQLADRLVMERDAEVVFTYGPGEEETVRKVENFCKTEIRRIPLVGIRALAALIRLCDAYVSNDCGPMHLGPAVGTPTVGIFGPGEPEVWFPYDPLSGHRFVHARIECSRCHRDHCERMDCMKAISVERVENALAESLSTGPGSRTVPDRNTTD